MCVGPEGRCHSAQDRCDKLGSSHKNRLHTWFISSCLCILLWTCALQFVAVGKLWHPRFITNLTIGISKIVIPPYPPVPRSILLPRARNYTSNGWLKVSCNGGLNQMRAAICDMVTIARLLNLTLVLPELDKTSFWADTSDFEDIFDADHFIGSLRDEVQIIRSLPEKFTTNHSHRVLAMSPVSWSNVTYYLQQILPRFREFEVLHFNKTDTRLANNNIPLDLQLLRCRVNFQALRFTHPIESLGCKLVRILQEKGPFVALHLRYETDMLAFSGCTRGCTQEEAEELKRMRYAYPWWRDKEIVSEERRSQGLCPLTPEETVLVLQALGFDRNTQIYIAAGEIYDGKRRLAPLRAAFPRTVRKETLLHPTELEHFRNHSSQMAALDFIVSVASNTFIPTYNGNMAKLVEGHRRFLGFKRTIALDRKTLVQLLDLYHNGTLTWTEFAVAVRSAHKGRMGRLVRRRVLSDRPKEEDYFYSNPYECLFNEQDHKLLFSESRHTIS